MSSAVSGPGNSDSSPVEDAGKAKQKLEEKKSAPNSKPPNRTDDRNFRSHYYEKVGFRGMDERKTLDSILKDDPISLEKCVNFALRCTIPANDRLMVWKLLLGDEPVHPTNRRDFVRWKERTYEDCKRFLKAAARIETDWPMSKTLTVLWLLFDQNLNLDFNSQLSEWPSQNFTAIAESMLAITSNSEIESFFLAKGLAQLLNKHSNEVYEELIQIYHRWLSGGQNTNKLYSHLEKIGLHDEIPLRRWFCRGFAGILHESALERLWDKVTCGCVKVLPFVAVALVEAKKIQLMACQTAKEAIRCLTTSTEDTDEVVVQKGIEMWSQDGGLLLPHLDPVSGLRSQPIVPQLIAAVKFPMVAQIKIDMSEGSIIEEEN